MHNDLSCQCSGTVCICGAPLTGHSYGGPDADHPKESEKKVDPKEKKQPDSEVETDSEEEKVCQGRTFLKTVTVDDEKLHKQSSNVQKIIGIHFQCEEEHLLCEYCRHNLDYCPCHYGFAVSGSTHHSLTVSLTECLSAACIQYKRKTDRNILDGIYAELYGDC